MSCESRAVLISIWNKDIFERLKIIEIYSTFAKGLDFQDKSFGTFAETLQKEEEKGVATRYD